ncbi:uncharacterized protein F4807DRAFT_463284 [Annulohypoxylon truncatum]|uniref:uncharacterized protein n=1 Tax=Annulohypoxylon truncatum TaxID=327061 RepID=UPI002008CA09|nr:uncharacterized protein F4807DRAFT_463284 [Annulohypoxylon truncatum]KAI1206886.1 hypothetical protein F4807DRAFT_463284 [Annulohypoxylon truncatum]
MSVLDLIIQAIVDVIDGATASNGKREIPLIAGPMGARNIIDTESVPRVDLAKRINLDAGPCGVPQYNFDLCGKSLHGVTIKSSTPGQGEAQYDNVPPTCMVLSTVLAGNCDMSEGPYPIPCGAACLLYTGVKDGDLDKLNKALGVVSNP